MLDLEADEQEVDDDAAEENVSAAADEKEDSNVLAGLDDY